MNNGYDVIGDIHGHAAKLEALLRELGYVETRRGRHGGTYVQEDIADRLESCLASPFMRFGGKDLYRGIVGKAAIMFYLLIKSHPFQNGNKRIAIMGTLYLLHSNGFWLSIGNAELYEFSRAVAASDRREKDAIVLMIAGVFRHYLVRLEDRRARR